MQAAELQELLEAMGAMRRGHFVLSSGLHSDTYVQCALVLQYPWHAERLGQALADGMRALEPEAVVAPALGGIILGYEVARALGVRSLFAERDATGTMALRRGFQLRAGERVLIVEDVWTTGRSTREVIAAVTATGAEVVGLAALVDRSAGQLAWPVSARALLQLPLRTYAPDDCPLCQQGVEAVRPGSRFTESGQNQIRLGTHQDT